MWPVQLLLVSPALALALAKGNCEAKLNQCLERGNKRPVCGTDNKTYPTRCHLLRTKCHAYPQLGVKHRGKCSEKKSCWSDEIRRSKSGGAAGYTPTCLPDGTFAPVQCHESTGYCWCASPSGDPIPKSHVRHSKPVCNRKGKTRRFSTHGGRKPRKECGKIERANFLRNLIQFFRNEFNGTLNSPTNTTEQEFDTAALDWKFKSVDLDLNKTLSRAEYKELRKQIKKIAKPKKCARSFVRICDVNRDMFISHEEWMSCLKMPVNRNKEPPIKPEEDSHEKEEPDVSNCLNDRKSVLEEQTLEKSGLYVPECTDDGRYQKVQCFKGADNNYTFCWCVDEDSGKHIAGTSVQYVKPNCDAIQAPSRPMQGCPEQRKQQFLSELMQFMIHHMEEPKFNDPNALLISQTEDERIATWTFMALDINKNRVLERKEWKAFRTMISNHGRLRRCGKRLPRYCDVNNDSKISLTEWLNCLDAQRSSLTDQSIPSMPKKKSTNGYGPEILKDN